MKFNNEVMIQLAELRRLLGRKDNDFTYSHWRNRDHALAEFDQMVASRNANGILTLVLPTSALQDVSVDSGWGDEFCKITDDLERSLEV